MRLFFLSGKQMRCKQVNHVEWWSQLHHLPLVPTCHVTSFQHASGTSRQGRAGGNGEVLAPSARGEVRAVLGNRYGPNVGRNASLERRSKLVKVEGWNTHSPRVNSVKLWSLECSFSKASICPGDLTGICGTTSVPHQHRQMLTLLILD